VFLPCKDVRQRLAALFEVGGDSARVFCEVYVENAI
jgi:hypothetical protein